MPTAYRDAFHSLGPSFLICAVKSWVRWGNLKKWSAIAPDNLRDVEPSSGIQDHTGFTVPSQPNKQQDAINLRDSAFLYIESERKPLLTSF